MAVGVSRGRAIWLGLAATGALAAAACSSGGVSQEEHSALQERYDEARVENRELKTEVSALEREVSAAGGETHLVSAAPGGAAPAASHGDAAPAAGHDDAPHFTYEGVTGPDAWGTLTAEWATCSTGTSQSPVDIDSTVPLG